MSSNICANYGKEGTDVTNTCNKCKGVMYCNAACKKKHRHKHKKECERRVAELHDERLFKQPSQKEDCPICFLQLPHLGTGQMYMACCGKVICIGCIYAAEVSDKKKASLCPFCRTPDPFTDEQIVQRYKKRMEMNDDIAICNIGIFHANGELGLPRSMTKALELWHRAGELGHAGSYNNLGNAYYNGRGVERDEKKAKHYYELAAMKGDVTARCNLGVDEMEAGNMDRALKHWMIAVVGGNKKSLDNTRRLYLDGYATKDAYTNALQAYQAYLDEIKSDQRDKAVAYNDEWQYHD